MAVILAKIDDLRIRFAGEIVVAGVNFEVRVGEVVCLVGESGSGKSLTAKALMGLVPTEAQVTANTLEIAGCDVRNNSEAAWQKWRGREIAMIFQEPMTALNPVMTVGVQVREMFDIHTTLTRTAAKAEVLELFKKVKLPDPETRYDMYPFELSGGQRQRVMIAMALALKPKLLIADEPTTALDAAVQKDILNLINELKEEFNTSVLLISHDIGVVADMADHVVVMEQGQAREQGPTAEVLKKPQHPYTQKLIAAMPTLSLAKKSVPQKKLPLVTVKGLTKHYPLPGGWFKRRQMTAVSDVSFALYPGEIVGIVGESGSGKSTVAKCLTLLERPSAGHLSFQGTEITALTGSALRKLRADYIQMVFQDPYASLNPRMAVGDSIAEGMIAHGTPKAEAKQRVSELLVDVGLSPEMALRRPHAFSGGQRQRIGIARALALRPKIIIADEAVSALDVSVQKQILALLRSLRDKYQLSLLFISHDLRVISELCDRILVMHHGRIVEQGPCHTVLGQPQHGYTKQLLASVPGESIQ